MQFFDLGAIFDLFRVPSIILRFPDFPIHFVVFTVDYASPDYQGHQSTDRLILVLKFRGILRFRI